MDIIFIDDLRLSTSDRDLSARKGDAANDRDVITDGTSTANAGSSDHIGDTNQLWLRSSTSSRRTGCAAFQPCWKNWPSMSPSSCLKTLAPPWVRVSIAKLRHHARRTARRRGDRTRHAGLIKPFNIASTPWAPVRASDRGGWTPNRNPAPSPIDVNQRQIEDAFLDIDRHLLLGPERAGTANQKSRVPVGRFRRARLDLLAPDLSRQFLGRHFAVAMHQTNQRLADSSSMTSVLITACSSTFNRARNLGNRRALRGVQ